MFFRAAVKEQGRDTDYGCDTLAQFPIISAPVPILGEACANDKPLNELLYGRNAMVFSTCQHNGNGSVYQQLHSNTTY